MSYPVKLPIICEHGAWEGIHGSRPAHYCNAKQGACDCIEKGDDAVRACPLYSPAIKDESPRDECIHRGEMTGETVVCKSCNRGPQGDGTRLPTYRCAVHGVCVLGDREAEKAASCGTCASRAFTTKPLMQVHSISAGIGDNLMTLAVGEGLRQRFGCELAMIAGGKHHPWLRLFEGATITNKPFAGPVCFCEHDVDTPSFKAFTERRIARWDYWAGQFGVRPQLPRMKLLPAASITRAVGMGGRVVLVPFAAYPERTWTLDNWLELEWQLEQRGFRTLILSDTAKNTERFRGAKAIGESPANVAALLNAAVCVVGNDSGIAHLAGMMRRPTVAICFPASDYDIFGMYPTVTMLGANKTSKVTQPSAVTRAVLDNVRAGLGDFPAERFDQIILERDRWRLDCWRDVYAVLWRTVRAINPRRIVEIGTRAGYSAWTMLDACPEASLIGIDANFDGDLAITHGGFRDAIEHAKRIMTGRDFTIQVADSQQMTTLPAADLAYVDGDHSFKGCLHDMESVERSGIPAMLVDDTQFDQVRDAIKAFLTRGGWRCRYIPSDTGLALLERL